MDQRSRQGEVKVRIYRNILLNNTFTVLELCAETGLRPDQVYPILAKLGKSGFLSSVAVSDPKNVKRAPHRPTLLYTLSDELEKRKSLAAEIAPFLQLPPETLLRSAALEGVELRLSTLSRQSEQIPEILEHFDVSKLQTFLVETHRLQEHLDKLKDDLEIAWYECNRSTKVPLLSDFWAAQARFQKLSTRLEDLYRRIAVRVEELNAEQQFSEMSKRAFNDNAIRRHLWQVLQVLEAEYAKSTNFYLNKLLSAVAARVLFAAHLSPTNLPHQTRGIACALAEAAVRFGSEPLLFFNWMTGIVPLPEEDVVSLYNLVNTNVLLGNDASAFASWKEVIVRQGELSGVLGGLKQLTVYRGAALFFGDALALDRQRFEELGTQLGLQGAFSLVSTSPFDVVGTAPFVLTPTVLDWFAPESAGFVISASMRVQQYDLFSYGPLVDIVQFPGLPRVRLATALVRLGVNVETAWRVAETLKAGKAVLVLHVPRADNSLLGGLQSVLPGFVCEGLFITERDRPRRTVAA
jgi:hypothetical protein